ncbi:TPA: hypothetical protein ACGO9X_000549 [Streptococcus suis]
MKSKAPEVFGSSRKKVDIKTKSGQLFWLFCDKKTASVKKQEWIGYQFK